MEDENENRKGAHNVPPHPKDLYNQRVVDAWARDFVAYMTANGYGRTCKDGKCGKYPMAVRTMAIGPNKNKEEETEDQYADGILHGKLLQATKDTAISIYEEITKPAF